MVIFEKEYCGESIVDLDRDISEMWDSAPIIPVDEHNIPTGSFKVLIVWSEE